MKLLKAHRIGHCLTAYQDPELVDYLSENGIPIEVCVTSNLKTGGLTKPETHPLRHYFDSGIQLSLNTDDPSLFGTNINNEYLIAKTIFGFSDQDLTKVAKTSFSSSFLPPDEKEKFLREFDLID